MTSDVLKRLQYHNGGRNRSTKYNRPWKIIYEEKYTDKKQAWLREYSLKKYKGGKALTSLLGEVA